MVSVAAPVFVGRRNELRALHDSFADASARRSQVLLVEGEPGIGKTTLVERFLAEAQPALTLRASGDESESLVPFAVADQLLRSGGGDSGALRADGHVTVGLDLLARINSGADEDGPAAAVVVVDDAQLADAASLRALLFAARRLVASRALVALITPGSEAAPLAGWRKLASGSTGSTLRVGPLERSDVSALGLALGVEMTADAAGRLWEHTGGSPLYTEAVIRELPDDSGWQHEPRPLPVPSSYAQLVRRRLDRCAPDALALIEAAAVLGVRAPLHAVIELTGLDDPLEALDAAVGTGIVHMEDRAGTAVVEFSHCLARAAVHQALPNARRSALHTAAAGIVDDADAVLRHRVDATTVANQGLLAELEEHAHEEVTRGAWSRSVTSLIAASRLSPVPADRERLALEAIEAMLYSGDGAAARRLVAQTGFADGPRRDSVLAYLAAFADDVDAAERLLKRAWERRALADDDRLSATIAQRSAFLATSRLRGHEAIRWARRAEALAPADAATGLLVAPSLALGFSFTGAHEAAHAALDRWLDDPALPGHATGFVLLALKGHLLLADGDVDAARTAFDTSADESRERGLFVVAALSLAGLSRAEYLAGAWDRAERASAQALALAVESEDRWLIARAHWAASDVPAARGDWRVAEAHIHAIREQSPRFERHVAVEAIASAGLAGAQGRADDALRELAPLDAIQPREGVDDPAFLPWQHLKAHALIDAGELEAAEAFIRSVDAGRNPLLAARLAHARGRLHFARHEPRAADASLREALATAGPLGMPYERALIELTHGRVLRRAGERRAASTALLAAHERLAELGARPALRRCETELAACGLAPATRKARDYTALTPQELAVARLVVAGMTNREVSEELMLSTKTVEFHLSHIYTKLGVRSRSDLRARARASELSL